MVPSAASLLLFLRVVGSTSLSSFLRLADDSTEDHSTECLAEELFANGCSPEVVVCTESGDRYTLQCPFSLWFDESTGSCVSPAAIASCPSAASSPFDPSPALPASFCSGFDDGFYPVSVCSSSVVRCEQGVSSLFECPEGQFFSSGGCHQERPDACDHLPLHDDCVLGGKHNIDRCSPLYLECILGQSRVKACSWPLVFELSRQSCELEEEVASCPLKSSALCPSDGLFAYKDCSSTFYSCFANQISTMHCPLQLVFDPNRHLCALPAAVAECPYQVPLPAAEETTELGFSQIEEAFCNNRADGFYAKGCNSTLISCVHGVSSSLHCPAPLVFDERKVYCREAAEVEECREKESNERRKRAESHNRHPPSGDMFHWVKCDKFDEPKVYQLDCQGNFFYCVTEMGFEMFCYHGFLYSQEARSCISPRDYGRCSAEKHP